MNLFLLSGGMIGPTQVRIMIQVFPARHPSHVETTGRETISMLLYRARRFVVNLKSGREMMSCS